MVTQEVEVEYEKTVTKSEEVTFCDECGREIDPEENAATIFPRHELNEEYYEWKHADHKLPSDFEGESIVSFELNNHLVYGEEETVKVYIPTEDFLSKFDNTRHKCLDCWEGFASLGDDNALSNRVSYEEKVENRVREELIEKYENKSIIEKIGRLSVEAQLMYLVLWMPYVIMIITESRPISDYLMGAVGLVVASMIWLYAALDEEVQ